jgi:hypothetical protein
VGIEIDFIIIHESGHEWFANNITYKDIADMWTREFSRTIQKVLSWNITMEKKGYTYVRGIRKTSRMTNPLLELMVSITRAPAICIIKE